MSEWTEEYVFKELYILNWHFWFFFFIIISTLQIYHVLVIISFNLSARPKIRYFVIFFQYRNTLIFFLFLLFLFSPVILRVCQVNLALYNRHFSRIRQRFWVRTLYAINWYTLRFFLKKHFFFDWRKRYAFSLYLIMYAMCFFCCANFAIYNKNLILFITLYYFFDAYFEIFWEHYKNNCKYSFKWLKKWFLSVKNIKYLNNVAF